MILKIAQKLTNCVLGGPKYNEFTLSVDGFNFNIKIQQYVERIIIIDSCETDTYKYYLDIFYTLETLLMLCDGHFVPTISVFENDVEISSSWHKRALPSYSSADFMLGAGNILIDYSEVIDEELFKKWYKLESELDLNFKTMLCCTSSVKMPRDMQCAFLTEAFGGIYELAIQKYPNIKVKNIPSGKSKLKYYLVALFENFGDIIFNQELIINKYEFAQILVNSRNRIAHISNSKKRYFLNGGECVMYLIKLSLLYRIIIFDQLELPQSLYRERLSSIVLSINKHRCTTEFIEKLKAISKEKEQ